MRVRRTVVAWTLAAALAALASQSHAQTLVFIDDFERADSSVLGNGWNEEEGAGVSTIAMRVGI